MMNRRVTSGCLLAVLVPALALLVPSPAFSGGTFQSMVNSDKTTQDLPTTAGVGGQWESGESLSLPPESHPAGRSYGEWAAAYIQWVVTTDADLGPVFGQNLPFDKVWFVEPGCADRTYTMPAGTFLLAPIWWAWNEYGCPWDPPLNEIPSLEDYLLEGLAWFYPPPEEVPSLGWEVLVDGRPVDNLAAYLATSSMFDVTFDPSWAPYDPCAAGLLRENPPADLPPPPQPPCPPPLPRASAAPAATTNESMATSPMLTRPIEAFIGIPPRGRGPGESGPPC